MSQVLEIRDLTVAYRGGRGVLTPAVRDVNLSVAAGETLAVVGESGSGKSTMASVVNRLMADNARVTSGHVLFEGQDILELPERQMIALRGASIGLVPQDPMSNLDPLMRIGAQIAEALEVHGEARGSQAWERAVQLLETVGIAHADQRARQYPHEFSGGMRQRVLIAMGLACRPRLLVADEPTSALDVTVQKRILDQLESLTDELGTAVLLITHDLGLAADRADRIAVMYRGEVVEGGSAREVLERPQHEYTRRLLGAAPSLATSVPVRAVREDAPVLAEVHDLVKEYPLRGSTSRQERSFRAVDEVSFQIRRGQTVSLVGESGSGKSTTANMILGLEPPTSGQILFEGKDLTGLGRRGMLSFRRRVQPVFQNPYSSLDPRFTVEQSIAEPLQVHHVGDSRSRVNRVRELLEQVALPSEMGQRLPHELSGGQRQRVAIARALALDPDLVVLDEAVSALDVLVQDQILELLADLQKNLGLAYLFISHDLAVVRIISDHVHVMQRGAVVESGTPEQIFDHPRHPYTVELLAAIPGVTVR